MFPDYEKLGIFFSSIYIHILQTMKAHYEVANLGLIKCKNCLIPCIQKVYNFQLLHNHTYFSLSTVVLFKLMAIFWKTAVILSI